MAHWCDIWNLHSFLGVHFPPKHKLTLRFILSVPRGQLRTLYCEFFHNIFQNRTLYLFPNIILNLWKGGAREEIYLHLVNSVKFWSSWFLPSIWSSDISVVLCVLCKFGKKRGALNIVSDDILSPNISTESNDGEQQWALFNRNRITTNLSGNK